MKIAITATANNSKAKLDNRFGRCAYFAIYDTELQQTEYHENPAKASAEGAGPASVQFIASKGVNRIISGEFGGKVKDILNGLKIQMVIHGQPDSTIAEIVQQFSKN
ncbi:NifB/NifX family molybdenum-iron cluster-binding protein [Mangrovibacterium marinum]|uniref:Putative Fe-Mo cluster-binding NifX family protein n=1 Tax=Mangrovibacterium marinum TaxID=1639118 RepID=A0A2T5C354_9BACT|nr:NifB/NifX family molybdenum-iron cluster-binding protein [Mangrovibacterium marinum]PTN09217.1 putative Fe-Mo cluster-binding NifX family protein [Mangrovibacterium marinum]